MEQIKKKKKSFFLWNTVATTIFRTLYVRKLISDKKQVNLFWQFFFFKLIKVSH